MTNTDPWLGNGPSAHPTPCSPKGSLGVPLIPPSGRSRLPLRTGDALVRHASTASSQRATLGCHDCAVTHWYPELARKGRDELWWYIFGDHVKHPLEMGSYFGRWCIEAVAAVKAFGLDDTLCLGLENYPGDLLRPDGPSTHVRPTEHAAGVGGWLSRFLRPRR